MPNYCPWERNAQQSVVRQFRELARARAEDCGSRIKASVVARKMMHAGAKHVFGSKLLHMELERGSLWKEVREKLRQRQRRQQVKANMALTDKYKEGG